MRSKWIVLFCSLLLTTALWGCGSGGSGGSDVGGGPTEPGVIGSTACQQCHASAHTVASGVNRTAGIDALVAPLAADETIYSVLHNCEDCHGGGQFHANGPSGNPIPIREPRAADCAACHEQVDGVFAWNSHIAQVAGEDQTACSSCHKPLTLEQTATTSKESCMSCHATAPVTSVSDISANVAGSMHYLIRNHSSGNCQRCHHEQGFLNFVEISESSAVNPAGNSNDPLNANFTGYLPITIAPGEEKALACNICHEPHGDGFRKVVGWDPNQNGTEGDQFDLCTACHNLYGNDGSLVSTYFHQTSWYRNIQSTHYDNPATGVSGSTDTALDPNRTVEGYVVRKNSANPCFDCHGHELRANTRRHLEPLSNVVVGTPIENYGPTIHTDWANSAHAGALLANKVAEGSVSGTGEITLDIVDAMSTGAIDAHTGNGWTHYNWDRSGRSTCQRCHTATGASNFLSDPAGYVAANNDFSHLAGWTPATAAAGSNQNELLYCWGCHVSVETGELRDPGALTISYTNDASVEFPDSAASNVCISCHSGLANGDSIKNDTDADGVRGFINSHYLTAGGTVFATSGYEYADLNYAFAADDRHQNLGYGAAGVDTGAAGYDAVKADYTSGPCVTCHFDSSDVDGLDRSHTLSPFTETATEGLVLNEVCVLCHNSRGVGNSAITWYGKDFEVEDLDPSVTDANLIPHKGRMLASLEALRVQLANNGIYFYESYPYFFKDPNGDGFDPATEAIPANGFTDWAGVAVDLGLDAVPGYQDVMGAAFNYNLLAHDPAATAHNRRYARRLIYDSIDLLDDGLLNNTTGATLSALDPSTPYKVGAIAYVGSRP